ncbi:PAS domain-containing protein [Dactylosporangium sp. NPDC051541]|uniref:sensor histidine kinase n=1 Tax=Dactylosporangium sp. NPDC051541 TaxID=3363977 RepID=UPI0037A9DB29
MDSVQEAFVAVGPDGVVTAWNRAAGELLGWAAAEVCGRSLADTVLPAHDGRPISAALECLFDEMATPDAQPVQRAAIVRHRDGRDVPVQLSLSLLRGPGGALACAFITDRTGEERQHAFLAALLDSLQVGVVAWDTDGRVARCNRTVRELFGLPSTLPVGQLLEEVHRRLYRPDGEPVAPGEFGRQARLGEAVRDVELVVGVPGAPVRYLSVNAQPIRGTDGRPIGAVAAVSDVSQQRRTERFRTCQLAVARILVGAADLAEAGPPVLEAVAAALGWPVAELALVDEVSGTLRPLARHCGVRAEPDPGPGDPLRPGEGLGGTVWATAQPVWVPGEHAALAVPIDDGAKVVGVLAGVSDRREHDGPLITGLLTAVAAQLGRFLSRRRADELGGELARTRNDFIALVGHDMRTPLTTIAAYSRLLLDDPAGRAPLDLELLDGIDRNAARLRALVTDLLDLAALEAGHLALDARDADLTAAVTAARDSAWDAAAGAGVTVHSDLAAAVRVPGDPDRLRQLAARLIAHAIGRSPDGGAVRIALDTADGVARLTVRDDGAPARGDVFERFSAANTTGIGDSTGGVSLAIARIIIERHRGTITVDAGNTVTVRLPLDG